MGQWNYNIVDYGDESSSVGVRWVDLTAANMTAQLALIATLKAAVDALILGTPRKESVVAVTTAIAGALPTNKSAQRETKWLVSGVDTIGLTCTLEIPTADLDALSGNSGVLPIDSGVGQDLADALNAGWRSRAGNLVTVQKVIHVGRNI